MILEVLPEIFAGSNFAISAFSFSLPTYTKKETSCKNCTRMKKRAKDKSITQLCTHPHSPQEKSVFPEGSGVCTQANNLGNRCALLCTVVIADQWQQLAHCDRVTPRNVLYISACCFTYISSARSLIKKRKYCQVIPI